MSRPTDAFRTSNGLTIDPARFDLAVIDLLQRRAADLTERSEKDAAIMDLRDLTRYFADALKVATE